MTSTIRTFSALLLGSPEARARHRSVLVTAMQVLRANGFSVFELERIADCLVIEAQGAEHGRELIFDAETGRLMSDQPMPRPVPVPVRSQARPQRAGWARADLHGV